MSYLIINDECVAHTTETLKNGETVRVAWLKAGSDLCNAKYAKASNAKKWNENLAAKMSDLAVLHCDKGVQKDFYAG